MANHKLREWTGNFTLPTSQFQTQQQELSYKWINGIPVNVKLPVTIAS